MAQGGRFDSMAFRNLVQSAPPETELAAGVDRLVAENVREDQWLELKAGLLLTDEKVAAAELRKQVSGFANAEGGVIVLGVTEVHHSVGVDEKVAVAGPTDGCRPVGGDVVAWVSRVLALVATARPRITCVRMTNGHVVVVVAVERAPVVVACPTSQGFTYYLRIGDSTHPVPKFLEADLLLGRRVHPTLRIDGTVYFAEPNGGMHRHEYSVKLTVSNDGMLWVPRYQVGLVALCSELAISPGARRDIGSNDPLRNEVDARPCFLTTEIPAPMAMRHASRAIDRSLAPFDVFDVAFRVCMPRARDAVQDEVVCAGAYVAPENGPPTWAQVVFSYAPTRGATTIDVVRTLRRDRPIVWWGHHSDFSNGASSIEVGVQKVL